MADAKKVQLGIAPPTKPEVETPPASSNHDAAPAAEVAEIIPATVDESVVRGLLSGLGSTSGYLMGDDDVPKHWEFTSKELDDLTPPLTRIVNRRPQLRRAVMRGDEATVGLVLAGYLGRNAEAGRKAKKVRSAREDQQRQAPGAPSKVGTDHGGANPDYPGGRNDARVPPAPNGADVR